MTVKEVRITYENGGSLLLQGGEAERWMSDHHRATKLATLAGTKPEIVEEIGRIGKLTDEDVAPFKPASYDWKFMPEMRRDCECSNVG